MSAIVGQGVVNGPVVPARGRVDYAAYRYADVEAVDTKAGMTFGVGRTPDEIRIDVIAGLSADSSWSAAGFLWWSLRDQHTAEDLNGWLGTTVETLLTVDSHPSDGCNIEVMLAMAVAQDRDTACVLTGLNYASVSRAVAGHIHPGSGVPSASAVLGSPSGAADCVRCVPYIYPFNTTQEYLGRLIAYERRLDQSGGVIANKNVSMAPFIPRGSMLGLAVRAVGTTTAETLYVRARAKALIDADAVAV